MVGSVSNVIAIASKLGSMESVSQRHTNQNSKTFLLSTLIALCRPSVFKAVIKVIK